MSHGERRHGDGQTDDGDEEGVGVSRRTVLGAVGASAAGSAVGLDTAVADEGGSGGSSDPDTAVVVLDLEPLARHDGDRAAHAERLAAQRAAYEEWMARETPDATVVYEYETVLNGLAVRPNGHGLDTLRSGPGVRYVTRSTTVHPTLGESVFLIDADQAWSLFDSEDLAGKGVRVAIIDSGIEHGRPFFRDEDLSFPDGDWPKGNGDEWDYDVANFTNEKVIAAYVFWDEDADLDPGDVLGHGTHVAGTAGGRANTTTSLDEDVSGVAPGAWLGNYNVFPTGGSTASENVIAAIEQAVDDEFDVINMSLGGPIDEPEDPLMEAAESAIEAGVVVVSSAGNSGPESETVTSPAAAPNVVAVGAGTNAWGVFDTMDVYDTGTDESIDDIPYLPAVDGGEVETQITGEHLVAWADLDDLGSTTKLACDGRGNPNDVPTLSGSPVVIVQRGECSFAEKAQNIKDAGGAAMVVYNRDDRPEDELVTMTLQNEVDLPSAFITNADGYAVRGFINDRSDDPAQPHVDLTFDETSVSRDPNEIAEFSSRGPGPELEIKPELTAPGVNIYASVLDGEWGVLSGTSMASPHTAGAAALQVALQPALTPWAVRSALVNNATDPVEVTTGAKGPMSRGTGLLQVGDAAEAGLLADPATVSFGELARNGIALRTTATRDLAVENVSGATQEVAVSIVDGSGGSPNVSASATELTLGAGERTTVSLTADASGQATGTYWGRIELDGDTDASSVPFWYRVVR